MSKEEMCEKLDGYFTETIEQGQQPTFCDMAGTAGFDSVTQMANHARRHPNSMREISRCFLAVGAGYEDQLQQGSRTAGWMLERMPQFDTDESPEQTPAHPFQIAKQSQVFISGLERESARGAEMSEQQAYLEVIKHKTYAEIEAIVQRDDDEEDINILTFEDEG